MPTVHEISHTKSLIIGYLRLTVNQARGDHPQSRKTDGRKRLHEKNTNRSIHVTEGLRRGHDISVHTSQIIIILCLDFSKMSILLHIIEISNQTGPTVVYIIYYSKDNINILYYKFIIRI